MSKASSYLPMSFNDADIARIGAIDEVFVIS